MRLFLKLTTLFVIIAVGVLLYISISYNNFVNSSPDGRNEPRMVNIQHGSSAVAVLAKLEREGVITSSRMFYYFGRINGKLGEIKYGEYEFTTSMKPHEVLNKLITGDVKKYKVTIPEGYNIYQVADTVSYVLTGINKDDFIRRAKSKEFAKSLGLDAPMLEGYLFPDTYYFTKDTHLDAIITKMVNNHKRFFSERQTERAKALGMTLHEVITLASIIEKETSKVDEMPIISAVFHNRLAKGMRLQTDPTVIYGIEDFNGNLTRKDLETTTPYNTYRIKGLPPTPIANPGLQAIKAAMFPAEVPYLYFVSKNNGTHFFSTDFKEHRNAVNKYQIRREKAED